MQAITQDRYGSADVLERRDVPRPAVGPDEVLVRVRAAGVDRGVWHLMTGLPYLTRAMFGLRRPKVSIPGNGLAGVVEEVGEQVTGFRPGDEVYGTGQGTFAEHAVAPASQLAPKPAGLTFEQAATLPHGAQAALQALRDHAGLQPGQHVLVVGASGAVGMLAVQLAKALGAEVTGVGSTAKLDLVRHLGADHVVDYTRDDVGTGGRRYDVIVDTGGNTRLSRLRRVLAPKGTLVIVGGEGHGRWIGIRRQVLAVLQSPFVRRRMTTFVAKETGDDLRAVNDLVEAGKVTPVVARSYPLADAAEAMRDLEAGRTPGRIALTVSEVDGPRPPDASGPGRVPAGT